MRESELRPDPSARTAPRARPAPPRAAAAPPPAARRAGPPRRRPPPRPSAAAARSSAAASAASTAPPSARAALEEFQGWLLANGAKGVGARVGIFEGGGGERGLAALRPARAGEALLKVPLRLAIADYPGGNSTADDADNPPPFEGAPWSARLAARLLRLRAAGVASPWAPYINAVPAVPPPGLSWAGARALSGYAPARAALGRAAWLAAAAAAAAAAAPAAFGLAPTTDAAAARAAVEWALAVVHSRTFAPAVALSSTNSTASGGPARMLVPLVDFLDHAGDFSTAPWGAPDPLPTARDNARWDVVTKLGGDAFMVVSATRDLPAGAELLLSYGERSNEEFLVFYGFVPPRNPHDYYAIFPSVEEGIAWWVARYGGGLGEAAAAAAAAAALAAAAAEEGGGDVAGGAALAGLEAGEAAWVAEERAAARLGSGGRLDARLGAAFAALHGAAGGGAGSAAAATRRAVAARARECLAELAAGAGPAGFDLLADLRRLAEWEAGGGGGGGEHGFAEAAEHYARAATAAGLGGGGGGSGGGGAETARPAAAVAPLVDTGAGAAGDAALMAALMAAAPAAATSGGAAMDEVSEVPSEEDGEPDLMAVTYRAYKATILYDAIALEAAAPA
jgi:hypothetical protein